jgi:hypothetical protein
MSQDGTLLGQIGAVDNLKDPLPVWNRGSTIIGMTIVFGVGDVVSILCSRGFANRTFQAITSTCVLLRLYARFRVLKVPGWDDYWMIFVLVCTRPHADTRS